MKSNIKNPAWLVRYAIIPLLCFLLAQNSIHAQSQQLFKYSENPRLEGKQQHYADAWIKKEWVQSYKYVTIDPQMFKGDELSINLPGNIIIQVQRNELNPHSGGLYSWKGRFKEGMGNADFVVNNGMITARISSDKFVYLLYPITGGMHVLIECNGANMPKDESPEGYQRMLEQGRKSLDKPAIRPNDPELRSGETQDVNAGNCKVRILVAYTDDADANLADPIGFVNSCIDATNTAYNNSGVNFNVELAVAIREVYAESLNSNTDKIRFHDTNDGFMDDVHDYRTFFDADMCILITENLQSGICGEAYTVANSSYTEPFCVVTRGCSVGNLSFPHELGHLYGCRHDTYVDNTNTPYAYGHGYVYFPNRWRTIMAYNDFCVDNGSTCNRIQYFSNPSVTFGGVAMGTTATNDNERALEASRTNIAGLESTLAAKIFSSAYTFSSGEQADVIGGTSVTNNAAFTYFSGSSGTWRSGTYIDMKTGFRAAAGSVFRAFLDDCTTLKMSGDENVISKIVAPQIISGEGVQIYPNPFATSFDLTINAKQDVKAQVAIFNSLGSKVTERAGINVNKGFNKIHFDGSKLSKGVYMVEINMNGEKTVKKIIKM